MLEPFVPPTKIGGRILWTGFDRMDEHERVRLVFDALKEDLSSKDFERLSVILPYTPREYQLWREEHEHEQDDNKKALAKAK